VTSTSIAEKLDALEHFLKVGHEGACSHKGSTVFQIQSCRAVDIREFSSYGDREGEFILPPGTVLRLNAVLPLGTGVMLACSDASTPPALS
jgi:hypothetical protein